MCLRCMALDHFQDFRSRAPLSFTFSVLTSETMKQLNKEINYVENIAYTSKTPHQISTKFCMQVYGSNLQLFTQLKVDL